MDSVMIRNTLRDGALLRKRARSYLVLGQTCLEPFETDRGYDRITYRKSPVSVVYNHASGRKSNDYVTKSKAMRIVQDLQLLTAFQA